MGIVKIDQNKVYDVLIAGGGPAGLTAAIYCMRKGLDVGLITVDIGGQVNITASIENYMGYRYIGGLELVDKFKAQVEQFTIGLRKGIKISSVIAGGVKDINLEDDSSYHARALIIATGKSPRRLNVPGEEEFMGRGVAYCATCDAPLYRRRKVAVVGGGNSGVEAAIELAKIAKNVTLIQLLEKLTADEILIEKLKAFPNVDILLEHETLEIKGDTGVGALVVINKKTGEENRIGLHGVFVEIGLIPNTDFAKGVLDMNAYGEIEVDCVCRTKSPGIFAAGDVTSIPFKQIIIAAGEGSKAALSAYDYLLKS